MSHSKKEYLESLRNNLKTLQLNLNDTLDKLDNLSDFDSSSGGSSPKDSDSNYQVNNILSDKDGLKMEINSINSKMSGGDSQESSELDSDSDSYSSDQLGGQPTQSHGTSNSISSSGSSDIEMNGARARIPGPRQSLRRGGGRGTHPAA